MKDYLIIIVTKIHIIKYHISLKFNIIRGIRIFVVMFPGPHTRSFFGFLNLTVFNACIYECYVSIIRLGFLIEQPEYTVTARKCHYHTVKLHAYLVNRHIEILIKSKETYNCSQCQSCRTVNRKNTSHNRDNDIAQVTELRINRTDYICICIGFICTFKEPVIELFKIGLCLFFIAEYLDHLLTFHHLFDKSVDCTYISLLCHKIFTA